MTDYNPMDDRPADSLIPLFTNNVDDIVDKSDSALLLMVLAEIRDLRKTHDEILIVVAEIKEQVQPMLNGLAKSPVLKMMGFNNG